MGKNFAIGVKGIIRREDGKILIVRRSPDDDHAPDLWETVGGGMDEAVAPQENLKREIMEEVGLEVEVREPFNVFSFTKDNGEFKIGITFICDCVSGEVQLSHEHTEFVWIDPADFEKYPSVSSLYAEIGKYAENSKFDKTMHS